MSDGPGQFGDAREALERFVVDNNDLLQLEGRIGRFNIFDALGVAHAEIRHSNFLAWLLDPAESHGQGSVFLKAVLMDLLKKAPPGCRSLSPVELDGVELQGVEIRREWRNIDLLIVCRQPELLVVIENKVDSSEHDGQLSRYEATIASESLDIATARPMFVFLTLDGGKASSDCWVSYSYSDLYHAVKRCRQFNEDRLGSDVRLFVDHYLSLLEVQFMDDLTIDRLCRRIYRQHQRAIELINARGQAVSEEIVATCGQVAKSVKGWKFIGEDREYKQIGLAPEGWAKVLPPICSGKIDDGWVEPWAWLSVWIEFESEAIKANLYVGPTSDDSLRQSVLDALVSNKRLRLSAPRVADWMILRKGTVLEWSGRDDPTPEEIRRVFIETFEKLGMEFEGIPAILKPVIDQWRGRRQKSKE